MAGLEDEPPRCRSIQIPLFTLFWFLINHLFITGFITHPSTTPSLILLAPLIHNLYINSSQLRSFPPFRSQSTPHFTIVNPQSRLPVPSHFNGNAFSSLSSFPSFIAIFSPLLSLPSVMQHDIDECWGCLKDTIPAAATLHMGARNKSKSWWSFPGAQELYSQVVEIRRHLFPPLLA